MPRPRTVPFLGCACGTPKCPKFGVCHCGCGEKTVISNTTASKDGRFKGYPNKFIIGHQGADRSGIVNTGEFKIDGKPCRLIPLSRGQYAIVNADNYDKFSVNKYHARVQKGKVYAVRCVRQGKTNKMFYMHREIFGLEEGDEQEVDHKEPMATTLNIYDNLRLAPTHIENRWNKRVRKDSATGLKWAQLHKKSGLYYSKVTVHGVIHHLGYHRTAIKAHLVALEFSKKVHGEFSRS